MAANKANQVVGFPILPETAGHSFNLMNIPKGKHCSCHGHFTGKLPK